LRAVTAGAAARGFELWASPEATVARVDAARIVDQLALTGHDGRDGDVARLAALGVDASRVPVLWERCVSDDPARIELGWARRRLRLFAEAGVEPIVTLLHHGSGPRFTSLLDPEFPARFAAFAECVARAFPWIRRWTPINEPLTTARFSTLYGHWYPNLRDDLAFGRALVHQTLAILMGFARIRLHAPQAQLVITEDLQQFVDGDEGARPYALFLRERMYLSIELVAGRVTAAHPLARFLTERCGVLPAELAEIRARAVAPDLVAFNHYPHSERYLFTGQDGSIADVPSVYVRGLDPPSAAGPLRRASDRLELPLALGEVHVHAPAAERVRWLAQHVDDVRMLRNAGLDLRAVGAWAAFGMRDWHSLLRRETGVDEDGIYTFAGPAETPQPTAVSAALATLARDGTLADDGIRGWWERADRYVDPHELAARNARGEPEGDHIPHRLAAAR
jgi:dTDP-4-dehydrorhamnose reductase